MLAVRPALPIDETRYLAVAWEMWLRGSVAVPYINGAFYDGKPPLLFWLMQLGWAAFGVSETWARLVVPGFGLATLFLLRSTALRLWSDRDAASSAPWILLGSVLWAAFCASTMFDALLGFCALLSVHALVRAWRAPERRHFVVAGLALGAGILAKGPVVFLPALFVVALAPWWMTERPPALTWRRWFRGGLGAAGIAALIALAWLVPMALSSDLDYLLDMTVKQTAGYAVTDFSHARPVWWYLPLVPVVLFPWTAWPRAWKSLWSSPGAWQDSGLRLCAAWTVGVFVAFSLIRGKQAHYLLLLFPAVALLLARLLSASERGRDRSVLAPAAIYFAAAAVLLAVASGALRPRGALWLADLPELPFYVFAAILAGLGAAVAAGVSRSIASRVRTLAITTCLMMLALVWALMRASGSAYDVRPISALLSKLEAQGAPLAAITRYDGQYTFYGRLKKPIEVLSADAAAAWARQHPTGYLLTYYHDEGWRRAVPPAPLRAERQRGGEMVVWRASDLVAHPSIIESFE